MPDAKTAWRRRERRKTVVSGALGFLVALGICATLFKPQQQSDVHPAPSAVLQTATAPGTDNVEYEPAASWHRRKSTMPVTKGGRRLPASLLSEDTIGSFPAFDHAAFPVLVTPNWGAMRTSDEWNRTYGQMTRADFVAVPRYDSTVLTQPTKLLLKNREKNVSTITAKLFYSTRFFGAYDLDAGEFSGTHPGVDIKLALNTPIGAIGGGRVYKVTKDKAMGLYIVIEHRISGEGTFYSLYGHLATTRVKEGDDVKPGTIIGTVGMTGQSTAPHLHLQLDRGREVPYVRFWPAGALTAKEADAYTVNPVTFIATRQRTDVAKARDTARAS